MLILIEGRKNRENSCVWVIQKRAVLGLAGTDNGEFHISRESDMASSVTEIAVIAVFLLLVYRGIVFPVFLSPLSRIPNAHWSAPVSSAWILWKRYKGLNNRTIHAAHERLGPAVRLAPSEISINCVDGGIKSVYTGGFEKHEWYPRVFGSYG